MLKNLKKNLSLLLKSFNSRVENLEKFIEEKKRFYYQSLDNDNNFLKVKIKEGKKVLKELKTEYKINQIFEKKFKNKEKFFPKLIAFGKYRNLNWILREKVKGILGGEMEKDFRIKKNFLKKIKPEKLAKIIFLYQNIKPKIPLYFHGGWWFKKDFCYHRKNFLEKFLRSKQNKNLISQKEIDLAQEIIETNKKILDLSANFLCHGDLYPNNLIINEKGDLIILDWSMATFNNFAFDVAFLYLMAQADFSWQKKFLKSYLQLIKEKEEFKELFRINLISLATRFSAQCYYLKLKKKMNEKKVFPIFRKYLFFFKKAIYQNQKI